MNRCFYPEVRNQIRDGDVLLFRAGRQWYSRLIAIGGRAEYSHAAMAVWWHDSLMCVEMCWTGGQAARLSARVAESPTGIDVYRCVYDGAGWVAASRVIRHCSTPYNWRQLAKAVMVHLPVARLLVRPSTDDSEDGDGAMICSWLIAHEYAKLGADLVPHLANRWTEPSDLARSALLKYQFTLT